MSLPTGHPEIAHGQTGLLLVNLGTPDSPDVKGLRPYLKQFLSDRRVIETPALVWQPILRGIILNTRPRKSAHAYAQIWDRETNESPLRRYTREQAEGLQAKLGDTVKVDWAMRYGQPSIDSRLEALRTAGCERIVVMALYPQYSATTTASVHDAVFNCLKKLRWQPALRTGAQWHDHPDYIKALARSVKTQIKNQKWRPDVLVASFHGLPVSYFEKGDPYHCQCAKTARLLREELGLEEDQFKLTFQSRFGPAKWLEPYTDKTIEALARAGQTKITVITPGFISDCVETLEEIGIGVQEMFMEAGGTHFSTVPCLNADPPAITLLHKIAKRELAGWV
ncbi:MAG: ferrochelatase [Parvibaculales bacterium]